jgi:acetyl esterase/lipase
MKRLHALMLGLVLCAGAHGGPLDGLDIEVAAQPVIGDAYPERRTAFAGGVSSLADVVYASPPGYRPLTLDLYLPPGAAPGSAKRYPVILYVHGGAWMAGHTRHAGAIANFPAFLAAVAARGYVVASVSYRLSGEAAFPAPGQDVKAAIRWLRAHADQYAADPARFGIWGGSAGAHLAGYAAASCGVQAPPPVPPGVDGEGRPLVARAQAPVSDCVQAAALWYGIYDLATMPQAGARMAPTDPMARLLGCTDCAPAVFAAASPSTLLSAASAPMLLLHGKADQVVPYRQSVDFDAALKKAGVHSELVLLPDVGHSMIGTSPEKTREATLTSLALTLDFFARMLK